MIDPVTMFKEGGPWMAALQLPFLGLPFGLLVALIVPAVRVRLPAVVLVALVMLPVTVGLLGVLSGQSLTLAAVGHASAQMQSKMAANGQSVALYPLYAGAALSALAAAGVSLALGLGVAIGAGREARMTPLHAVVPGLIALLSPVGLVAGVWLGSIVSLGTALGIALASLRLAKEPEVDLARTAAGRAHVGMLGLLGLTSAAVAFATGPAILYLQASANASAEMRDVMMGRASEGLVVGLVALGVLGVLVGIAMLASVAPVIRALLSGRTLGSGALAAGVLLVPAGLGAAVAAQGASIAPLLVSPANTRRDALAAAGIDLPEVEGHHAPYTAGPTLRFGADVTLDDAPVTPESFSPPAELIVEADAKTPLTAVLPFVPKMPADTHWAAIDFDLVAVPIPHASAPGSDDGLELLPTGDGWALVERKRDARVIRSAVARDDLWFLSDSAGDTLDVWMPEDADVRLLVGVFGARPRRAAWTWRLDPPPALPPRVTLGELRVEGDAKSLLFGAGLNRSLGALQACYVERLAETPTLAGEMEVSMTMRPDRTMAPEVTRGIGDAALEACVVEALSTVRGPPTMGDVKLTLPITFAP
ncbi:MAG: hypothetical protein H6737_24265 [Alphaproteobacteria bacterium]|nr:hypothetical protein [Alphaproteobacteria bacterium]